MRRNAFIPRGSFTHSNILLRNATADLAEFRRLHEEKIVEVTTEQNSMTIWEKPQEGSFNVNWDISVDSKQNNVGNGVAERDHEGHQLAVLRAPRTSNSDMFTADLEGGLYWF